MIETEFEVVSIYPPNSSISQGPRERPYESAVLLVPDEFGTKHSICLLFRKSGQMSLSGTRQYQITYQPFGQSDLTSSDIVLYAEDEQDAKRVFEREYPAWTFVKAETL